MLHYPPPYDNQNLGNIQYRTKVNNDEEIKLRKTHPLLTSSFEVSRSILDIASPPPCQSKQNRDQYPSLLLRQSFHGLSLPLNTFSTSSRYFEIRSDLVFGC